MTSTEVNQQNIILVPIWNQIAISSKLCSVKSHCHHLGVEVLSRTFEAPHGAPSSSPPKDSKKTLFNFFHPFNVPTREIFHCLRYKAGSFSLLTSSLPMIRIQPLSWRCVLESEESLNYCISSWYFLTSHKSSCFSSASEVMF